MDLGKITKAQITKSCCCETIIESLHKLESKAHLEGLAFKQSKS